MSSRKPRLSLTWAGPESVRDPFESESESESGLDIDIDIDAE
jgi:hypothetical protein